MWHRVSGEEQCDEAERDWLERRFVRPKVETKERRKVSVEDETIRQEEENERSR